MSTNEELERRVKGLETRLEKVIASLSGVRVVKRGRSVTGSASQDEYGLHWPDADQVARRVRRNV